MCITSNCRVMYTYKRSVMIRYLIRRVQSSRTDVHTNQSAAHANSPPGLHRRRVNIKKQKYLEKKYMIYEQRVSIQVKIKNYS